MNDYLLKAIDNSQQVRIMLARTTGLVEEARRRHHTSPTASAALGRVLTAAVMMGSDMKGEKDITTIRINGNGPCGPIIATADPAGNVRGLISEPEADVPSLYPGKLAVGNLVGKDGFLEVSKDLGLQQPFVGKVPLVSGEIGEDIASYYLNSEQIPALVAVGVLVAPDVTIQAAGGLIIQALPGASDEILELVESNVLKMPPISTIINDGTALEESLTEILKDVPYRVVGQQPLHFKCTCNRERLQAILASLSLEELQSIYHKEGKLEVVCNFCREVYTYTLEEIEEKKQKP
ncbi:MAG TPA: Hsp33 family molecular chaperone HslO [Syntrophomonas sp.]|jgi:molecular chaperone Hsp33|nr:Hsp33 family molecular chaperone HslO [Syntrophomonas sp.]HCF70583.1 Hsp33 family molecular chaperone HslO [Syntrophomonas sp.]